MASPDVVTYLGLELVDTTAQDLIAEAMDNLTSTFPDWVPREGNTEVVLLEQLAGMTEQEIWAINRLPNVIVEALLRHLGQTRDPGQPASADVVFTMSDTLGHVIPQETALRITLPVGDPIDLVTTIDLTIDPGDTTGTVAAAVLEAGTTGNGTPTGTSVEVLDALPYVDAAALDSALGGGTDPEDGDAFIARTVSVLGRLTTTLVRPSDFESFVLEQVGVSRAKALDLYNPAHSGSSPGDDPGYVAVAVAGAGGAALTTGVKNTILAAVQERAHAGLVVNIIDPTLTTVAVTCEVLRYASANSADVQAAVTAILTDYLNADTWNWGSVVRHNELIARIDTAAGVDAVISVTVPSADLPLTGVANLVTPGTIVVTVDAP
jgi:hypothetical protein